MLWLDFYPRFKFSFLLFWGMVMHDNEFETKETNIKPKIKLNHNIYRKLPIISPGLI